MLGIRTIVAVLIASSVPLLPPVAGAAMRSGAGDTAVIDKGGMPCCPECGARDNFKSIPCLLKCATHAGAILPAIRLAAPFFAGEPLPSFRAHTLRGIERPPPTHPPQV